MDSKITMFLISLVLLSCAIQFSSSLPSITDRVLYQCNFDKDTCGMTLEPTTESNKFAWVRFMGSTPSWTTGPDFDHTTGNGYYMYTEATDFLPGEVAKLHIPTLTATPAPKGAVCLTFWYHMYGQHIGTLNVTQGGEVLWSLSFNQSNEWIQQNVTIRSPATRITFEGVRGGNVKEMPYGDIAIDDVIIFDGTCGADQTTTVTTTVEPTTVTTTTVKPTTVTTTVKTTTAEQTTVTTTVKPTTITTTTVKPTTVTTTTVKPTTLTTTTVKPTTLELTTLTTTTVKSKAPELSIETTTKPTTLEPTITTTAKTTIAAPSTTINPSTVNPTTDVSSTVKPTTVEITTNQPSTDMHTTAKSVKENEMSTVDLSSASETDPFKIVTSTVVTSTENMVTDLVSHKDELTTQMRSDSTMSSMLVNLAGTTTSFNTRERTSENSMATVEAQGGFDDQQVRLWGLTESNMILILAILCAIILLLIIVIVILACFLCVTKRKYNVERSANIFRSETSTVDGVSTVDGHRGMVNKYPASLDRVDEY